MRRKRVLRLTKSFFDSACFGHTVRHIWLQWSIRTKARLVGRSTWWVLDCGAKASQLEGLVCNAQGRRRLTAQRGNSATNSDGEICAEIPSADTRNTNETRSISFMFDFDTGTRTFLDRVGGCKELIYIIERRVSIKNRRSPAWSTKPYHLRPLGNQLDPPLPQDLPSDTSTRLIGAQVTKGQWYESKGEIWCWWINYTVC